MAIWYAYGAYEMAEGIPASACTTGDLLMVNSSSSLSRLPYPLAASTDIAGVAATPSDRSVNNKITYIKARNETVFWSDCTPGSTYTPGANVNFSYDTVFGKPQYHANGSTGTVRGVVIRGVGQVEGQSTRSRILVRLLASAAELLET